MTATATEPVNGRPVDVEQLYREQRGRMVGHAARVGRDPHAAEDAVHEAFADILTHDRDARNPAAYLTTVARHAAITAARSRQRQAPGGDAIERAADRDTAGDGFAACMGDPVVAAKVDEALAQLPDQERRAIRAHLLEGAKVSEIAKAFGVATSTVYSRINAGLDRLREAGIVLVDADTDTDEVAVPDGLSPALAAAVQTLRATYGDTAPADLPGTSELSARHGWDKKKTSAARAAYTGAPMRSWRRADTTPKKAALKKATRKATPPTKRAAPVPAAPAVKVAPVPSSVAEAWLSQANQQVTCMFVHADESTSRHPAVFRSLGGAQREITGHLVGLGYQPTGPWTDQGVDESSRPFSNSKEST